jgi:hypothetical protein
MLGGGGRTRTYEGVSQRIYSPPPLPLGTLPRQTGYVNAGNTLGNSFVIGLSFVLNRIPTRIPRDGERPATPAHVTPHLDRDNGTTRRRITTHHRHWYL